MKRLQQILVVVAFFTYMMNATAQTEQMRLWAFNGTKADFTGPTVTTQSISTPLSGANGTYASYYDENDQLLVRVVDNTVYDENNNVVDQLFDTPQSNYKIGDQMVIVPKEQNNSCEFYIFYSVAVDNYDHWEMHYSLYNRWTKTVTGNQNISLSNTYSTARVGNFTLSDFIGTTNERRLYMVYFTSGTKKGSYSITLEYLKVTDGAIRSQDINTFEVTAASVGEVELASDLSFLTYTSPSNYNYGRIYFKKLNTNGTFDPNNAWFYTGQLGETFIGAEISKDNTTVYSNTKNSKFYAFDMTNWSNPPDPISFTPGTGNMDFTNSQIERASNDNYYVVNSAGKLGYFTSSYFLNGISVEAQELGSSAVIKNGMHENDPYTSFDMYVIPDQTDGCTYNYTTGTNAECCYLSYETPVSNVMEGVETVVNPTTGNTDIHILDGNNVTWSATSNPFNTTDVYLPQGDIIVEKDAQLVIHDMNIHFRENKKIELTNGTSGERGSKLYLFNTVLTSARSECDAAKMWYGIKVDGNWAPQTPDAVTCQAPYLKLDNSTIEYSQKGVECAKNGNARIINSTFKDNIEAVSFVSGTYEYSSILNSTFRTTNDLYIDKNETPQYFIRYWNAQNVDVRGCSFRNEASQYVIPSYYSRGAGIVSTLSNYDVTNYCTAALSPCPPASTVNCYFENLYYGIKDSQGSTIKVENASFVENIGGIWVIDKTPTITECDFNVANVDGSSNQFNSFGLYLDGCTGYQIEENHFHDGLLGCEIYNSGPYYNEIYKNTFTNLHNNGNASSIVAVGENRNSSEHKDGLTFLCNNFSNTDYAISVLGGILSFFDPDDVVITSVSTQQGKLSGSYYLYAGNDFCSTTSTGEKDFHFNDGIVNFGYEYFDDNSNPELISYNPVEISRQQGSGANTCPSNLSGGIIIQLSMVSDLDDQQNALETEIAETTSGINELGLVIAAQTANSSNESDVHAELMSGSPYLSDTILKSYLNNNQVSELSRTTVLKANSPLPTGVKSELATSDLSPELKAYLNQYQNGVNELEQMYNRLGNLKRSKMNELFKLERTIMQSDTEDNIEAAISYFESDNSIFARDRLFNIYMQRGDFSNANTVLEDLEARVNEPGNYLTSDMLFLREIKLQLTGTNASLSTLSNSDIQRLTAIGEDVNNIASSSARATLEAYGNNEFFPMVELPNAIVEKSSPVNSHETIERHTTQTESETRFNIFPNPVNDKLSVEYITLEENSDFIVFDIQGKVVKHISGKDPLGYFVLDVSDFKSGHYILYSPQLSERKQFVVKH